ncbi:MAG: DUF3575 domain-containing protein, partial [Bacteroidales bacterium]|nr:DUF3575 domain-containing protein [Bacteroidales bacterium]
MRQTLHTIIVTMALLATAVSAYAQKQGTDNVDENMLRYRYIDSEDRTVRFSGPRSFSERTYFFAGTGMEGLYQLGNHPESPGYAIGSRLGMGYWFTPLHGLEASLSYGMMPYGYWGENFLGNPVIANTIIKNIGLEANYIFNITNHTQRHDKQNTFDFQYSAGINLGAGDKFLYGINTSLKAVYNISSLAGLYVEPKLTFLNFQYIRPSISAGFVFRFKPTDKDFEKPVDLERKKLLFALKSNALFWIAGAPNFGIEYPINNRWSVCGDYVAPWSSSFATGLYYQLMMINAEARYWFGKRDDRPVMTGWFAGANIGGGYYDFMLNNKKKGLQGEFYILAGLSAGYSHSISSNDRVRLEYALGLGYLQTRYRKYYWDDFDYVLEAP